MKIKPVIYGLLVISVFFGIILGFQSAGIWSTSGKVDRNNNTIQPMAADPTTIKGWMSLEQIVTIYEVPLIEILNQFDLPSDTLPTTALKDLESDTFDTSILIEWLQNRTPSNGIATPSIAETLPVIEPSQIVTSAPIIITPGTTEHTPPEQTITGKTTFQDLLDWGVAIESIQDIIGEIITDPGLIIKDYVIEKGLEFSTIKTILQTEVDRN